MEGIIEKYITVDYYTKIASRTAIVDVTIYGIEKPGYEVMFDHSVLKAVGQPTDDLPLSSGAIDPDTAYMLPYLNSVGGYTHTGWYIGGVFYEACEQYVPSDNVTAYSVWQAPSVTITMMVEGAVYATLTVPQGSCGVVFTPEAVDGIFTGWFYDSEYTREYDPVTPIEGDLVLYAKGIPPLEFTTDPVADGDIRALSGQPGTISFRATDSQYYSSVKWDFGDGDTSDDLYSTHYYEQPGTYKATLTVYNNQGSDTREFIIEVPEAETGGRDSDLLLWIAIGIVCIIAGGLVVRRLL